MGIPNSSTDKTYEYIVRGRHDLGLPLPDRESFILIAASVVVHLEKVFGSEIGLGTIGSSIQVPTRSLSEEVMSIRAEDFVHAQKDKELHAFFFGSDGKLHELEIDVEWNNRTLNHSYFPVMYLGVVEPVRIFDLYATGFHDASIGNAAADFIDAAERLLRQKAEKTTKKLNRIESARSSIVEMKDRHEEIRRDVLRREYAQHDENSRAVNRLRRS